MEVCSSTEMGAPGASHLGTGDRGSKTDRSRPRSVLLNTPGSRYPDVEARSEFPDTGLHVRSYSRADQTCFAGFFQSRPAHQDQG
jgi:hypothetical protein